MKLSTEQYNKIVNHIQRISPDGLTCPVCGSKEWLINDTIFQAVEYTGPQMEIGRGMTVMPFVVLNCKNCNNCLQFNAIHLGLVKKEGSEATNTHTCKGAK